VIRFNYLILKSYPKIGKDYQYKAIIFSIYIVLYEINLLKGNLIVLAKYVEVFLFHYLGDSIRV